MSRVVPRRPQESVLFGLAKEHLEDFLRHAREVYDGPLLRYVLAFPFELLGLAATRPGRAR